MKFPYDKSSKWLIQHHADAILRLGGVTGVESWTALAAELVLPRQLPDGVLEVQLAGRPGRDLFVLEICTSPENRMPAELLDDLLMLYLDRHVLPEVLTVVLHPKGQGQVAEEITLTSPLGLSRLGAGWRVINLWTLPAAPLLAEDDPGLAPWILLTDFDGLPETIVRQCRDIIDRKAKPEEHENLLVVTQILAGLRYTDPALLTILGGKKAMIESPVLQNLLAEVRAEERHKSIVTVLQARFGPVPEELAKALEPILDGERLEELTRLAVQCPDLEAFAAQLTPPAG